MDSYTGLLAPHEYEPDYDRWWQDLRSLETTRANVSTYDDWFPDLYQNAAPQLAAEWTCPINHEGCTANCGNYGCGN